MTASELWDDCAKRVEVLDSLRILAINVCWAHRVTIETTVMWVLPAILSQRIWSSKVADPRARSVGVGVSEASGRDRRDRETAWLPSHSWSRVCRALLRAETQAARSGEDLAARCREPAGVLRVRKALLRART